MLEAGLRHDPGSPSGDPLAVYTSRERKTELSSPDVSTMDPYLALLNATISNWSAVIKHFSNPKELFEAWFKGPAGNAESPEAPDVVYDLQAVPLPNGTKSHLWAESWVSKASEAITELGIAFEMRDKLKKHVASLYYGEEERNMMSLFKLDVDDLYFVEVENVQSFFKLMDLKRNKPFADLLEINRFKIGEVTYKAEQLKSIAKIFQDVRTKEIMHYPLVRSGCLWRIFTWISLKKSFPTEDDLLWIVSQCYDSILHCHLMKQMKNPKGIQFAFEQGMTENFDSYITESFQNDFFVQNHPCRMLLKLYSSVIQKDQETRRIGLEVVKVFFGAYSFPTILSNLEKHVLKEGNEIPFNDLLQMSYASVCNDEYPLNTALNLSNFFKQVGDQFVNPEFYSGRDRLTEVAINLVESIPSDTAALLYIMQKPGDLEKNLSAKYVALKTANEKFFSSPRIARVIDKLYDDVFVFRQGSMDELITGTNIDSSLIQRLSYMAVWGCLLRLLSAFQPQKMSLLYNVYNLPRLRFNFRAFGYFLFLTFFCVFLFRMSGNLDSGSNFSLLEIVLYLMALSFLTEEIKQMYISERLSDYFASGWNLIDLVIGLGFGLLWIIRVLGRWIWRDNSALDVAVLALLAVTGVAVPIRVLSVLRLSLSFGPFLKIIGKMTQDIIKFVFLAGLIWLGFSIGFTFLLHSNDGNRDLLLLQNSETMVTGFDQFSSVSLTLFSSFLGTFEMGAFDAIGNDSLRAYSRVFFGTYLTISLIVLFNLLIAMMTTTYEKVRNAVIREHLLDKASLIYELYQDDGALPPPFTFVVMLMTITNWIVKKVLSFGCFGAKRVLCTIRNRRFQKIQTHWFCQTCFHRNELENRVKLYEYLKERAASLTKERAEFLFPKNVTQCSQCFFVKNSAEDLGASKMSFNLVCLVLGVLYIALSVFSVLDWIAKKTIPGYSKINLKTISGTLDLDDTLPKVLIGKGWVSSPQSPSADAGDFKDPFGIEKSKTGTNRPDDNSKFTRKKAQLHALHAQTTMINLANTKSRISKVNRVKIIQSFSPILESTLPEVINLISKIDGKVNDVKNRLTASLVKDIAQGPPWKYLYDFNNAFEYTKYCKDCLKPGMLVMAVRQYEKVQEGELGEFVQSNDGFPPCQVKWRDYGDTYWLYWKDIVIVEGEDENAPSIMSKISKQKESEGYPWKQLNDFPSEKEYTVFCKRVLSPGMRLRALEDHEGVTKGTLGEFLELGDTTCKAYWSGPNKVEWLPWKAISICDGEDEVWKKLGPISGPPWKNLDDFKGDEVAYSNYLKAALKKGMKIMALNPYECISQGDVGVHTEWNGLTPPCQAEWKAYGNRYWLWWKDIVIVEGTPNAFLENPDVPDGPPYFRLSDFKNEAQYSIYVKRNLKDGVKLRAVCDFDGVREDDVGDYVTHNDNWPSCLVSWSEFGKQIWCYWRNIELIESDVRSDDWKDLGVITGPPWNHPSDFSRLREYKSYMKAALATPNLIVRCIESFESVMEGDVGVFRSWSDASNPPVCVEWKGLGVQYYVQFRSIQIVQDTAGAVMEEVVVEPGPPWKRPEDFSSVNSYALYLKQLLKPGMRIRCIHDYDNVKAGDLGEYLEHNTAWPPCRIKWRSAGNYWMFWNAIEIVEGIDIASLIKSTHGPPWKTLEDFSGNATDYAAYMKMVLQPGMLVQMTRSFQPVMEGDIGEFLQFNDGTPPCQMYWRGLANTYWVEWKDIKIVHGLVPVEAASSALIPFSAGPSWLGPEDFKLENEYASYMKAVLKPGMNVVCLHTYESIQKGDRGQYLQYNSAWPPCQLSWKTYGSTYWMFWRDVRIVEGLSEEAIQSLLNSTAFKTPAGFETDDAYIGYIKSTAQIGLKVSLIHTYQGVIQGDTGTIVEFNDGDPPCQVQWDGYETTYWVPWQSIIIINGREKHFSRRILSEEEISGPPWKKFADFDSEDAYASYLKRALTPGMKVKCSLAYESIHRGDMGEYVQHNGGYPPVQIDWKMYGSTYWVYWKHIEIIESVDLSADVKSEFGPPWKTMADFNDNEDEYIEYMKMVFQQGLMLRCAHSYESVCQGDVGSAVMSNDLVPPVQVFWKGLGTTYWLNWRDLEVVHDTPGAYLPDIDSSFSGCFKTPADFATEVEYSIYLKQIVTPGMKFKCVKAYESIVEGDVGLYVQHNSAWPPCQINWSAYGSTYWMFWRDIALVDCEENMVFMKAKGLC